MLLIYNALMTACLIVKMLITRPQTISYKY